MPCQRRPLKRHPGAALLGLTTLLMTAQMGKLLGALPDRGATVVCGVVTRASVNKRSSLPTLTPSVASFHIKPAHARIMGVGRQLPRVRKTKSWATASAGRPISVPSQWCPGAPARRRNLTAPARAFRQRGRRLPAAPRAWCRCRCHSCHSCLCGRRHCHHWDHCHPCWPHCCYYYRGHRINGANDASQRHLCPDPHPGLLHLAHKLAQKHRFKVLLARSQTNTSTETAPRTAPGETLVAHPFPIYWCCRADAQQIPSSWPAAWSFCQ